MIRDKLVPAGVVSATLLAIGMTFGGATHAASPGAAEARYQQDRANCMAGHTAEDQKTCLKEAGARLEAARKGDLSSPSSAQLAANARKRCEAFTGDDRRTCLARIEDGSTSGSVAGGGELREYKQIVPGVPQDVPPTAAGPSATTAPTPVPQGQ